ncbi:MAG: right-handed parallel beta-helix repeat-containing protein, partial [Cytophagales bacterium]|nr:right-handed parallel beta-helix repeat-containing protein [Cytophagales bacterium]
EENRWGVRVLAENFGEMKHIRLQYLYVHDVNGWLKKSYEEGCGIYWEAKGDSPSWFNGLYIENCHLTRTDRNGICGMHPFVKRAENWNPSLNVVIRGNLLVDIGGDAIKPWGCDGALVEYNIVRGARTRCDDYAAGIWPWSCDNTLIQYNEVSGVKGYKDGQGFDSDYNCRNTIFQYNYSHDNEGGFMLICTPKPDENNVGCVGTIIRYNLSVNDQTRTFDIGGGAKDTHIYNNTIYVGKGLDVKLVNYGTWGEDNWSDGMYFYNNIFYADEGAVLRVVERTKPKGDGRKESVPGLGKSTNNHFISNAYYGQVLDVPEDPKGIYTDPMLKNPGSYDVLDYGLKPTSPCIDVGKTIADKINDYFGRQVTGSPDIGAMEFEQN